MLKTKTASPLAASATAATTSDFLEDTLSGQTLPDDHLTDGGTGSDAPVLRSLPGARSAKDGLAVADSSGIEEKSQADKDDTIFQTMDGDHRLGFTFEGTDNGKERALARGGYNRGNRGESEEQGEGWRVHVGRSGEKSATKEKALLDKTGVHTVKDYQAMIKKDFNFGNVVSKMAGSAGGKKPSQMSGAERFAAGKDPFLRAVVERFYPDHQVGDPETAVCESIALNIWSYATRGMDMNDGVDIAELQGLLYVFDQQIKKSSDSNTKMTKGDDDTFVVPGTEGTDHEIRLQKGDGRHGRATILTTRHLLADMTETPIPPKPTLEGFDTSYMLLDKSNSMQRDEYQRLSELLNAGGIDGEVALAAFDADDDTLAKVRSGRALSPTEASQILSRASEENATSITAKQEAKDKGEAPPEVHFNAPELNENSGKITNEEGMANALKWANDLPTTSSEKRQLVIVTDEPDFNPGVLTELQKVAQDKDLSVKVLYSYSKRRDGSLIYGGNSTHYVLIDLMRIQTLEGLLIQRKAYTGRNADGSIDKGTEVDSQQLDWGKLIETQGLQERRW